MSVTSSDSFATPGEPPSEIDTSVPHSARIWNYWLGGKDNYPIDQLIGNQVRDTYPDIVFAAQASRHYLARAVRYLAGEAGIRQFLDVGTGLPTADNTHEIAQRQAPECRIAYVDNDPLVLVHANALLTSTPEGACAYIEADLKDPDTILSAAAGTLDLSRPVALILNGIMGHVADTAEAHGIVRRLLDGLPSGSYLSLSDGTDTSEASVQAHDEYNESGAVPYNLRSPEEIAGFFDGLELVEPGVVPFTGWRPDPDPFGSQQEIDGYAGVGRKP
ncbi:SAM-dependent methyltransferase [Actinomadura sp. 7K507]|nr:SAM-dependent methyltransferase [Actinomadura sp. 7K507]